MLKKIQNKLSYLAYKIKKPILISYRTKVKPEIVKIAGVKLPIPETISPRPLKAIYGEHYEKYELEILQAQLKPDDVVMELGTGLGLLSSYCARKIGSDKVFTYEANPELEPFIQRTYTLNQVKPNLKICLLGEHSGERPFYISQDFWASSTLRREPGDREIKIPVYSLNEEIRKIDPTLLILDIEGGEYDLLQYADFYNIQKIIMELHPSVIGREKADFVLSKLASTGFRLNSEFSFGLELFFERDLSRSK